MTLVHGDDYVSSGMTSDLDWMQKEPEKEYDLKTQRTREGIEKVMWVSPSDRFGQNSFPHGGFLYSFADNSPPVLLPIGTSATPLA